jgi:hypothetical protein
MMLLIIVAATITILILLGRVAALTMIGPRYRDLRSRYGTRRTGYPPARSSYQRLAQLLPHVGLGQAELPGDLRWLDANLEGGANRVQLARRQMNGDRLDPRIVRGLNRLAGLPAPASLLFGEYGRLQSVELLIVKLLDGGGRSFGRTCLRNEAGAARSAFAGTDGGGFGAGSKRRENRSQDAS